MVWPRTLQYLVPNADLTRHLFGHDANATQSDGVTIVMPFIDRWPSYVVVLCYMSTLGSWQHKWSVLIFINGSPLPHNVVVHSAKCYEILVVNWLDCSLLAACLQLATTMLALQLLDFGPISYHCNCPLPSPLSCHAAIHLLHEIYYHLNADVNYWYISISTHNQSQLCCTTMDNLCVHDHHLFYCCPTM